MLRINFRSINGDPPTIMQAICVRFGDDGTLRGPDNFIIARALDGGWQVSGRLHRDLECEGPVRLRIVQNRLDAPRLLGPFRSVRTMGGILYGDDAVLDLRVPGLAGKGGEGCHQLTMLFEGGMDAKT